MKNYHKLIINAICFLLILLWFYAAVSKVSTFGMFRAQMHRQLLPLFLKNDLVYILPPAEMIAGLLLLFERSVLIGLYLSFIMMLGFTVYVGLAVFKVLGKVPCSCGGILSSMGWNVHLVFNTIFLLLTILGIYQVYRERRAFV